MADIQHSALTGADAVHPFFLPSGTDPGAIGAYKGWYNTANGELKVRNAANTGWLDITITGTSTALADHIADAADAHDASAISFTPAGTIAATDVQAAIEEVASEAGGGSSAGHTIQDEGSSLTARTNLNFTGAGVTVSDDAANDQTDVTIPGGNTDPASETTAGIAEIATQAETNAGTDDTRIVSPAKLAGRTASETQAGIAEIATQAETNAGSDDARAITPAKLAGRTATDSRTGVVELATDAETQTGTDATRAVTPASLTARSATETRAGIAELATQAETDTGTDDARIVTPAKLAGRGFERTANKNQASGYVGLGAAPGTPDGTKFLRDDGTWQSVAAGSGLASVDGVSNAGGNVDFIAGSNMTITPDDGANTITFASTGGGSGYRTLVELGSDVSTSATSGADITGLSFAVSADTTYRFYALIIYTTSNTANGSSWGVNGPASPTLLAWNSHFAGNTSAGNGANWIDVYGVGTNTTSSPSTQNLAVISGIVRPSAGGTLQLRFKSEDGAQTITAKAGSTLEWW